MMPGETAFTRMPRLRVFDRKRLGRGVQAALGQRRQHRRHARIGVVDQAGRDLHDVAAALLLHLGDGELRDVEEARDVDAITAA